MKNKEFRDFITGVYNNDTTIEVRSVNGGEFYIDKTELINDGKYVVTVSIFSTGLQRLNINYFEEELPGRPQLGSILIEVENNKIISHQIEK